MAWSVPTGRNTIGCVGDVTAIVSVGVSITFVIWAANFTLKAIFTAGPAHVASTSARWSPTLAGVWSAHAEVSLVSENAHEWCKHRVQRDGEHMGGNR